MKLVVLTCVLIVSFTTFHTHFDLVAVKKQLLKTDLKKLVPLKTEPKVSLLNDEDPQGKRRLFPRVKHLISNKEWEDVSSINNSLQLGSVLFFLSLFLSLDLDSIRSLLNPYTTIARPSSISHTHTIFLTRHSQ